MVERAGISKGVFFKYFKDKESLFLYVCESALNHVVERFPIESVGQFNDLFSFLKYIIVKKIKFYKRHSMMYRLFLRITRNPDHPTYSKIAEAATVKTNEYLSDVVKMLRPDKLKPRLNWKQSVTAVLWVLSGLQSKYLKLVLEAADDEQFNLLCGQLLLEMEQYFMLL
ncbi:TetR/AcrR family transcriptional regulator [Alicyclobacillaceae bacterium I2511]|nr:TetR/AcrR family transcriptional regulator [Alicyclobacillaceae bacterium I2511]